MIETEGRILKWGNSMGIRINKKDLANSDLTVNDSVKVKLEKKYTTGKDIFGKMKIDNNFDKELKKIDELFGEW